MRSLAVAIIAFFALAIAPAQNKSPNWKRIRACGVTFSLPPGVREKKVQPIDSCVRQYRGQNMLIDLDTDLPGLDLVKSSDRVGTRRGEYSDSPEFNLRETIIDRQKAEIITCLSKSIKEPNGLIYLAVLYVPRMAEGRGDFTMWTQSKSPEEREKAIKVLESVRFSD